MRRASLAGLATLIAISTVAALPVHAEDGPLSNNLPAFVTGSVPFEVSVAPGTQAICSMTYGAQERKSAPWTFTFDPADRVNMIRVEACTGGGFNYYLSPLPELAYFISRNDEVREAGYKSKFFVVNNVELDATVQVLDPSGKLLVKAPVTARTTPVTVTLPAISSRLADLQIVIASNNGVYTVKVPIPVARGWARVASPLPLQPCSSVLWRYDIKGMPKTVKSAKVEADIAKALSIIGAASGHSFTRVKDAGQMVGAWKSITFSWRAILGGGTAESNAALTKEMGGLRLEAQVWLNPMAPGSSDKYAGSAAGAKSAIPGRVWPIARAVLHVMGLENTREKGNLMYPVVLGPARLGVGDRFALETLYTPKICR
jgi:hypothetical protein